MLVKHENLVSLFFYEGFQFDFDANDVWTMFHSHCFDFSVWEMYGALFFGGKLIIIPKMIARDPEKYLRILDEEKVTILNQTPSAFYNLTQVALMSDKKNLQLRYVIFGGEALQPKKLASWNLKYPDVKLINMFGITETTVHVTYKQISQQDINSGISNIGKPIPSLKIYVLDNRLNLCTKGMIGEIHVAGAGVSGGYINQVDLTCDKFIENKYKSGERLYKSGDLVKISVNGDLEYIGRKDNQVQLRGFRIELGEIESSMLKHSSILDVVVDIKKENELEYLCGYYVSDTVLNVFDLRSHLIKLLPHYMITLLSFMRLESIPLTFNSKIDRKKLPLPEKMGDDIVIEPTNANEERVVEIWKEILETKQIGIDSDFFANGGDSIKSILLINRINKNFNSTLSIADVYEGRTIRAIANLLDCKHGNNDGLIEIENKFIELRNSILQTLPNSHDLEDVYPMSDIQKGMIYHSLMHANTYHDQMLNVVCIENFNCVLMGKNS